MCDVMQIAVDSVDGLPSVGNARHMMRHVQPSSLIVN